MHHLNCFTPFYLIMQDTSPEDTPPFIFANLSTELVLLVFSHAARPTFVKIDDNVPKNPYASALSLCSVSKIVRRTALPQLLRTVLLSEYKNVTTFVRALRMQHAYAQQGSDLHVDYAGYIDRIWFGQICEPPPQAPVHRSFSSSITPELNIDFSLLAPVLLSAPSLALDFESLWLLYGCLESTWNSHICMNNNNECSAPPWNTKTLTLVGEFNRWRPLTSTAEGSALLASISRLTFLSPTKAEAFLLPTYDPCFDDLEHRKYPLPEWMTSVPWASFKSLQSVSLTLPRIVLTVAVETSYREGNVDVELLTLFDPPQSAHWAPKDISAYTESGEGCVVSIDVRAKSEDSPTQFSFSFDWEEAWARGLPRIS
ncbi:hypothetical protein DEU56DRAFT_833787 [Suillus clintonianus]|uniref:uncharacterized protein n=1 Tax=Suillus clintonianus TaxID=1904413 RepID=UPI001B8645C2|nr:uncharacterized protein DEU56DRAFT_833787 [Suillus clintonianus]KAG2121747.1 hypothetical protein DEU56DRAFT_833787 [Suillus clintonianus]